MRITDTVALAIRSLYVNRTRTLLSGLGIAVGVASVIVMVSIAASAERQVSSDIVSLGANMIIISPGEAMRADPRERQRDYSMLMDLGLANEILEAAPLISAISPVAYAQGRLVRGSCASDADIVGISSSYMGIANIQIQRGRGLTVAEIESASPCIVLGQELASRLFGQDDPLGRTVAVVVGGRRIDHAIVGITVPKGNLFMTNFDEQAFVPVTCLTHRMLPKRQVHTYYCQAESAASVGLAVSQAERFLESISGTADAFAITTQEGLLEAVRAVAATMTVLLGVVAGISLVVGGIGIMNTILASVAERTREIGVRKSLGARNAHIAVQFLVEAIVLSLCGGAIGMALGITASLGITHAIGWPPTLSLSSVAAAIAYSSAVGMIFGVFPAVKASLLDPVEALRHG